MSINALLKKNVRKNSNPNSLG